MLYLLSMKTAAVFVASFLILVGVTLMLPGFPPAQLLLRYFGFPQLSGYILGFSVASLVTSVLNGLLWAIFAASIYGVILYAGDRKPLPPMPQSPNLSTPPPEAKPVDPRTETIPPALTVLPEARKNSPSVVTTASQLRLEQDVEIVDGIGPTYGALLRISGINSVNDLLRACATERRRQELADRVGVPYSTLLRWVYRGDLLRVRGVGRKYATLLESAGVNSVSDLSTRNPRYLCQTLRKVNSERRLVRRTPPSETIEIWVNTARTLQPIVKYG